MYIQDQVSIGELDDEHLSFFRAIGVDSIHLELRGGAPTAGVVAVPVRRIRRWHRI